MSAAADGISVDFALDELPGDELHAALSAYRAAGPIVATRFLGIPAFIIAGHSALKQAFLDCELFPPHRMYQASLEPAIGPTFISLPDPAQHRMYRKLAINVGSVVRLTAPKGGIGFSRPKTIPPLLGAPDRIRLARGGLNDLGWKRRFRVPLPPRWANGVADQGRTPIWPPMSRERKLLVPNFAGFFDSPL